MAYSVDLIYSKNQDLSDHSTETESGQPSTMELTNLESQQRYYAKAILKNDGVTEDESDIETFETLAAGTISLDFVSAVRNGNNYVVTYTVSSTYALSSAILSTNNTDFQGSISGNTIVFEVSGLTHGDAYLYNVNAIDIYAESATVSGTITTTVINEVTISDVAGNETDVTCYMTYTIESGFTEGLVEYWNENDDPSTAQPQGHSTFTDGETSCKLDNLTPGTTYQFRATIYYGGNVNHVESNVVKARTAENQYASKYFTVTNTSSTTNTISLRTNNSSWAPVVSVSTDNGNTWQDKTATYSGTALATLSNGKSVIIKHTGALSDGIYYCIIVATQNFTVSGNVASLCFGDDFNTGSVLTMPDSAYYSLFTSNIHIVSAENLYFGDYTSVSVNGFNGMFSGCTLLATLPDLSNITTVGENGMWSMFYGCTALKTPPDLSNITSVGTKGMYQMFYGCTKLATPPVLSNITEVGAQGMWRMFEGCTSLTTPPDLSNITSVDTQGMQSMFSGCTSLATPPVLSNITSVDTQGMQSMFSGCTLLATPPDLSNITSVGDYGMYYMFNGCTSLTTGPDLSNITTVGEWSMCYMFSGCTSLETPPDLSSITTVDAKGMASMFYGCTSLATPPDLRNITTVGETGMNAMFRGCTALATPPDLSNITSVGSSGMGQMFYGCTALTTPPDLSNITSVGSSGMEQMFYNCTRLKTPPDLSNITSVGSSGMGRMFYGCTALKTPPDLSNITSVGTKGMYQMFYGCTALTKAYAPTITWDTSKTLNWLNYVAASGTLYADSSIIDSIPTSNVSGCPSGWNTKSL